jgi:regulatory protein
MRNGQAPLSLKARALAFLSAREHSRSELRAKLMRPVRVKPPKRGLPPKANGFELVRESVCSESADIETSRASDQGIEQAAKVDAVLDELETLKYLSDERFVESLAHRRAGRFGVLKLKHELKSHKIAEPLAKEVLDHARNSELENAGVVWARKFSALPETQEDRAKQQRFLASRGFSASVVYKVLKGRVSEED